MKYNYIVLGSSSDLYRFSYSDFKKTDYAYYIPGMESNLSKIGNTLFRFHTWKKLNRIIPLPFKQIWNGFLLGRLPVREENKTFCFVFFSNWVEYENQLHIIEFLRKKYKGCRIVWFLQDIIATRTMSEGGPLPVEELKEKFDLVMSFDQGDCEKYGLIYHHLVFSTFEGEIMDMPNSDVYFVGKAKNRQKEIVKVYELLKSHGLRCDFHIANVPASEQVYSDDIDYNPNISYQENLQHILHTKCLLEIMQQDGAGFTQRGCEAVCLDKKLLTNNPKIKEAPFYHNQYISQFSTVDTIDEFFLMSIGNNDSVDYGYKQEFSPIKMLEFIEHFLP